MNTEGFKLTHDSATAEKALAAAARVEVVVGRAVRGERRAWDKLVVQDMALLVQFVRNHTPSTTPAPDCGEAGHDEGRCGNKGCLPGSRT